ncbi:MAG: aminotransferase class I/II-fold pyridoxal phosphate-dependent enzyme [Opitutales bacterium]
MSPQTAEYMERALAENYVAYPGPFINQFEALAAAFTSSPRAAAFSSATAALHLSLIALGVGPGDVVITSDFTFVASANPIVYQGATPVFVDSEPCTWNMDPDLLREAVEDCVRAGKKPKAVLLVYLYGLPARLDEIMAVCAEYDIPLVEDAAESLGCNYKGRHVGTFGKVGCLSFNGNKVITCGGGGMLLSGDGELLEKAIHISTQARDPAPFYLHSSIGYNYRISNLLAAVGVAQMGVLQSRLSARRANYEYYRKRLSGVPGLSMMPDCAELGQASFWLSCFTLDASLGTGRAEAARLALDAQGIEARRLWMPMHMQPLFKGCRVYGGAFGEDVFARGLCLPSGSSLTQAELDRVCTAVEVELTGTSRQRSATAAPLPTDDMRARVLHELEWVATRPQPLALVSTTAREGVKFAVTPRRSCMGYDCACFMLGTRETAQAVLPLLDGKVDAILVDVEGKQSLDLCTLAKELAPGTRLVPCKPNDATVESVDHLLGNRLGADLAGRRILVYGMGNLGSKIALRVAERGAQVFACSRDADKCRAVADAINAILPRFTRYKIQAIGDIEEAGADSLDAIVSCASGKGVVGAEAAALLRRGALAVDGGIDNFNPAFYEEASRREIVSFRLDTRIGYPYLLLPMIDFFEDFFTKVCGSVTLADGVCIVSGGYVGRRGAVIVDNFSAPTQIVGIASGTGGLMDEASFGPDELRSITIVKDHVESTRKTTL